MANWNNLVAISSVADIFLGGTPSRNIPEYWNGDIIWASAKDIASREDRYIYDASETITEKGLEKSAAKILPRDTVVITARGTVGALRMLGRPMAFNQTCYGLIPKPILDPTFLYYALKAGIKDIKSLSYGTVFDTITIKTFESLLIPLPPLPEQRAIAEVLGALDDKIELNRRMNRTLESIAQALFKEWFVENPESEGWEHGSILNFANLLSGGTPKTSELKYWNGQIYWVSAKDVGNAEGYFLLDTEKKITQEGIDNSNTKLLPEKTTIVTARGTVGAYCLLGRPMTMNQTNYGLKAKDGVGDYFVYLTLKNIVEQLHQQSYGTIFDTITTRTFQDTKCIQPPLATVHKFENQVIPIMDAILNNQEQNITLAELRDTLLPKLMKGEIRL